MVDNWKPNPGPQTRFLSLTCREALYGGAAGGGKSEALLVDAIRYVGQGHGPAYQALLLRRTFPDLEKSLIQRSLLIYPQLGGVYKSDIKVWKFPGGERVCFGHLDHDKDVLQYQSAEFQFIGIDELTQWNKEPYVYLFSRLRSSKGIPLRMRAGTNPGGPGHDWVFQRWGPWLDPDCSIKAAPGEILYFTRSGDDDVLATKDTPGARGRCFVPAKLDDNQYLARDGEYARELDELDLVERERLKHGNWLVKPAAGLYFKRQWCEVVDAAPEKAERVRYWDRAATQDGGDWTAGVRIAKTQDGIYWVEDVNRFRGTPEQVLRAVKDTAKKEPSVLVGLSQEPGSAGIFERNAYEREFNELGIRHQFVKETGDKLSRFRPFSALAERHMVKIVKGKWNEVYYGELEGFPDVKKDDQVDGTSGAMTLLARPIIRRMIPAHISA